jgi:hypothetical protein
VNKEGERQGTLMMNLLPQELRLGFEAEKKNSKIGIPKLIIMNCSNERERNQFLYK